MTQTQIKTLELSLYEGTDQWRCKCGGAVEQGLLSCKMKTTLTFYGYILFGVCGIIAQVRGR